MKKIIVPVDFSEHSENALKTAAFLAKKHNSEILVIHIPELLDITKLRSAKDTKVEIDFFINVAKSKLNEFIKKDYLNGIKLTPKVKINKLSIELDVLAVQEKADLIVMGSHGATGLKELFVGSNTEKIVRNSLVPVLVVKDVPITSDFKTAIFACNFSKDEIPAYKKIKNMLEKLSCNLQLLYVNTPYANFNSTIEIEEKVHNFLKDADGDLHNINDVVYTSDYTVEKGILRYANSYDIDLIILATHGRKGISHFIEGSISEDVANHSDLPVMTFKI